MQQASVSLENLQTHFQHYIKGTYTPNDENIILNNCINLFRIDYEIDVISNENGSLCTTYPSKIIIIQSEQNSESVFNNKKILNSCMKSGNLARVRSRLPVPVIFYNGNNISRSSTLSQKIECIAKSAQQNFSFSKAVNYLWSSKSTSTDNIIEDVRNKDIELIKSQNIKYICDLMVEDKKCKYGIYVSSSEKTDKHARYADFCITAIPFPGTEFFQKWHYNNYKDNMAIDWNEFGTSSTDLVLDPEAPTAFSQKHWQSWDIIKLTQSYLKLILTYLASDGGVLIHCISGWDRTPLYVSLVRISLWADGAIHQNLSPLELLYLTINYDWLLFHHQLPERTLKGEDIFYFCFFFLSHITSEEYSIDTITQNLSFQKHSKSKKITIRNTEEDTDDSVSGSFGSCGRSWEMTGGYMNNINVDHCSFISDSTIKQNIAELTSQKENNEDEERISRHNKISEESEDSFDFDADSFGEDSFCFVDPSEDISEKSIISHETNDNSRKSKLLEVQKILFEVYSNTLK